MDHFGLCIWFLTEHMQTTKEQDADNNFGDRIHIKGHILLGSSKYVLSLPSNKQCHKHESINAGIYLAKYLFK